METSIFPGVFPSFPPQLFHPSSPIPGVGQTEPFLFLQSKPLFPRRKRENGEVSSQNTQAPPPPPFGFGGKTGKNPNPGSSWAQEQTQEAPGEPS